MLGAENPMRICGLLGPVLLVAFVLSAAFGAPEDDWLSLTTFDDLDRREPHLQDVIRGRVGWGRSGHGKTSAPPADLSPADPVGSRPIHRLDGNHVYLRAVLHASAEGRARSTGADRHTRPMHAACDAVERSADATLWPFPTYHQMLFQ